ncbi:MAG TPA: O-antigen ligase family protein [Salinivirgaceae bacterium]|nr:O-antigen ligase family protein [Salinivirgaceae bacterium]
MTFIIPISSRPLGIVTAIVFLEALIRKQISTKENILKQLTWRNPGVWLFAFYFMHIIGLFYTENMEFAYTDLGKKATIAIFPLIFLLYQPMIKWRWFVNTFIAGTIISIVINLSISTIIYIQKSDPSVFTGVGLAHLMHRGYWTIYLLIAVYFLFNKAFDTQIKKRRNKYLLIALFIIIFAVLLLSKIGFIIISLLFLWFIIKLYEHVKKWIFIVVTTSIALVMFSTYLFLPSVKERIDLMFLEIQKPKEDYDMNKTGSTEARLLAWESSIQIINENFWFGVGTGDVEDKLKQQYSDNGYFKLEKSNLNSHNQFLNSHVALGVFAPLFLLMAFFINLLKKRPTDKYHTWRFGVTIILFLALLIESMLEAQAGIIPYAFLLCFFYSSRVERR